MQNKAPVVQQHETMRFASEDVRRARAKSQLSIANFAQLIGVSSSTIIRWEAGTTRPSLSACEKMTEVLEGTHSEALCAKDSRSRLKLVAPRDQAQAAAKIALEFESNIDVNGVRYEAIFTSWARNAPLDQQKFHRKLAEMQFMAGNTSPVASLARRLAFIQELKPFGDTALHRLEQPKATAVSWNSNYGSHGWHRYVGRFPSHLVRALLNHFGADQHTVVCDPFSGSGTTAVECRLLGIPFKGIEICPLSCLIGRTKSKFPVQSFSTKELIQDFEHFYTSKWASFVDQRDIRLLPHAEILTRPGNLIQPFANIERWLTPQALLGVSIAIEFAQDLREFERDIFFLALSAKMRSIGNVDVDVVRAEYSKVPRANVDVLRLVQTHLRKMERDIAAMQQTHADLLISPDAIEIQEGSVLDVDYPENSISHIITSPPYGVESLSYLRTHLLSYRCLESELKHNPYEARDKTIGSEYTPKSTVVADNKAKAASSVFCEFFNSISDDLGARKFGMMQFFDDIYSLGEKFDKWLKPGGKIAFVIGNKRLGEHLIPADRITIELFEHFGLRHTESIKHKLKTNNSNSSVPWQDKVIDEEFVIIFQKK